MRNAQSLAVSHSECDQNLWLLRSLFSLLEQLSTEKTSSCLLKLNYISLKSLSFVDYNPSFSDFDDYIFNI